MADGILEHGVVGLYMPEFNLDTTPDAHFTRPSGRGSSGSGKATCGRWSIGRVGRHSFIEVPDVVSGFSRTSRVPSQEHFFHLPRGPTPAAN
jgi:hypothetical protein